MLNSPNIPILDKKCHRMRQTDHKIELENETSKIIQRGNANSSDPKLLGTEIAHLSPETGLITFQENFQKLITLSVDWKMAAAFLGFKNKGDQTAVRKKKFEEGTLRYSLYKQTQVRRNFYL